MMKKVEQGTSQIIEQQFMNQVIVQQFTKMEQFGVLVRVEKRAHYRNIVRRHIVRDVVQTQLFAPVSPVVISKAEYKDIQKQFLENTRPGQILNK